MIRAFWTLLFSVGLAAVLASPPMACGQEIRDILVGRWQAQLKIDDDRLSEIAGDQKLDAASIATMKEQLSDALQTLELNRDGTSLLTSQGFPGKQVEQAGKWSVGSSEPANYLAWESESFLTGSFVMKNVTKIVLAGSTDDGADSKITIFLNGNDQFIMTSELISESPFERPVFRRVE